jgi:GDPmannose 4,6-dehydratase
MFGSAPAPQSENTPFEPRSPYATAKVYAYWMVGNYREGYNLFACNGILFNHESPRRGETFATRKITRGIAQILANKEKRIYLGNLSAKRDWGYAPEYVEVMWQMLQQATPDDYVIGAGEAHSVEEFVNEAFKYVNLDRQNHVVIEPKYFRPTEVLELRADAGKSRKKLNWVPKITFKDLFKIMVDGDLEMLGLDPPGHGKKIALEKGFQWLPLGPRS